MTKQWYVGREQKQSGPYSWEQLVEKAKSGEVSKSDLVWSEGQENWVFAEDVEGLFAFSTESPPPIPSGYNSSPLSSSFETSKQDSDAVFSSADQASSGESPKKKSGLKIALIVLGSFFALLIIIFIVIFASVRSTLRSSEVYAQAMSTLQSTPEAVQLLGSPVEGGRAVSGSINVSNGSGDAELSIPVSGSLQKGDLIALAERENGQWQIYFLELQLENGQNLNLLLDISGLAGSAGNRSGSISGVGAAEGMVVYSEPYFGFAMHLPDTWTYEVIDDNAIVFQGAEGTDDYNNMIMVNVLLSQKAGGIYAGLEDIYQHASEMIANDLQGEVVDYDSGFDYVGDTQHEYITYAALYDFDGVEYGELVILINRDADYYYQLIYTVPTTYLDQYLDLVFDDILSTFQFIPFNQ